MENGRGESFGERPVKSLGWYGCVMRIDENNYCE